MTASGDPVAAGDPRRSMRLLSRVLLAALVQELRSGNDRLDKGPETIAVGSEFFAEGRHGGLVRRNQASPQRIREELAAEIIDELVLALLVQVAAQPVHSRSLAAVGKCRLVFDRPPAEVFFAPVADRSIPFEHEADRIETLVTPRAGLGIAVPGEQLRQRQFAERGFVFGKLGDFRRRWWNILAKQAPDDPVPALDRARP